MKRMSWLHSGGVCHAWLMVPVCVVSIVVCWGFLALGGAEVSELDMNVTGLSVSPEFPLTFSDPRIPELPQTAYDDFFKFPDTTVPEPVTLLLILPGMALLIHHHWRRTSNGRAEKAITVMKIPLSGRSSKPERLALVGRRTNEVMHDVKNMLSGLRTCVEVMRAEDLSREDRQEFVNMMVTNIDRLMEMTEEVLAFSRGESQQLHVQPWAVHDVIEDLHAHLKVAALDHDVIIRTGEAPRAEECLLDFGKMQRVLLNLAANALDAMPDGGTLTIGSHVTEQEVQFEIRDTGCGMTPECRAHLFEPFFTSGKSHGTGLGMVIAKEIIEAHHGRLDIQSEVGTGTSVRVSLPLYRN